MIITEVMGDSPFEANLLQFYRSTRNGLSHLQVSIKAVLGRLVKCLVNRRKNPECYRFSPIHLSFQSSWGHLKLGLTSAFNRLCTLHLCKSLSEISIPRKRRSTCHVSMFCGPEAYPITSTACHLHRDGPSAFGLAVSHSTHPPDPKQHKKMNSSFVLG